MNEARARADSVRNRRLVLAFEVELSKVCGLDYMWRLCEDGRLVLEAQLVVKREFVTVGPHAWSSRGCFSGAWQRLGNSNHEALPPLACRGQRCVIGCRAYACTRLQDTLTC